ncbi:MAG TPA: DUF2905 domain-containing protein [Acidimicrobiia bacterium]
MGNTLIVIGGGLVVLGILARLGWLAWFGNLPGDIRIENQRTRVFAPITSMILLSVVGSIVINLVSRWFGE